MVTEFYLFKTECGNDVFQLFFMYKALCMCVADKKNRLKHLISDFSQKHTVYILLNAR